MKTSEILTLVLTVVLVSGCGSMPQRSMMTTAEYAAKEPIATSLFPSDQAVLGDEAIAVARQLRPKRTIFTHICHDLGHDRTNRTLPAGMELGHDGQRIGLT